MSETNHPSRRSAMLQLAAGAAALNTTSAAAQSPASAPADFARLQKELSNWGRWGKDDQMGAVNLITPEKRKQALRVVKEGASFSMARTAELEKATDNSDPIVRKMIRTGVANAQQGPSDTGGSTDS